MTTWQTKKLGEILSLEYGKGLTEKVRVNGDIPVYGSNGLVGTHNIKLVDGPGIIVGRKGSIGAVVWSDSDFWPIDTTYYVKLRQNEELRYIYFLLQSLKLNSLNKASGVPGLNRNDVYQISVKVPPLSIQHQIVEKLDAIRKLQELNNKEIEKTEELFNSLLNSLLKPKKDWQTKKLGELAEYINGYPFKPTDWASSGLPIIRIQNLNNENKEYHYFSGDIGDKYRVRKGDILISWSASLGSYIWDKDDAWLNQHIFKVIVNENVVSKDFFYFISMTVLEEMKRKTHGGTMKHITKNLFENIQVKVPPLSIQQQIIERLDAIRKLQELKKLEKEKLSEFFESALNKAMKGELTN